MNLEAWIFFTVLIAAQVTVLTLFGRTVQQWRSLLPAPRPADWLPFEGDRLVGDRPSVALGSGWLPVDLDPGATWTLTVVPGSATSTGGDEPTAPGESTAWLDAPAELIVLRRTRFPPPAAGVTRSSWPFTNGLVVESSDRTGLRVVPCGRSFAWVREARRALEVLHDEPDGVALLLDELGVAAVDLLVAVPAALLTEPDDGLRPDP